MSNCKDCDRKKVEAAKAKAALLKGDSQDADALRSVKNGFRSDRTTNIKTILDLRALGATRIKVGDVEAEWPDEHDCGCKGSTASALAQGEAEQVTGVKV